MYIVCIYTCYDMCAWSYPTVTPQTVGHQAPLSMGFSRQECWSRLPFPTPWDIPNPGIEPGSSTLQADSSPLCHQCINLSI